MTSVGETFDELFKRKRRLMIRKKARGYQLHLFVRDMENQPIVSEDDLNYYMTGLEAPYSPGLYRVIPESPASLFDSVKENGTFFYYAASLQRHDKESNEWVFIRDITVFSPPCKDTPYVTRHKADMQSLFDLLMSRTYKNVDSVKSLVDELRLYRVHSQPT